MEQVMAAIDYAGVAVFAMTGCLIAARKHLDVISFILLGTVTGIGGGTLRDVLLDRTIFWMAQPNYLMLCAGLSIVMFFIAQHMDRYRRWILWGDAVGIAVFTVTGTSIAVSVGAHWSVCILMGVTTSIVGGIVRDLLAGEPSLIVRKEIYATACVAGACVFLLAHEYFPAFAVGASIATTFAIRAAAIRWRLQLPGYRWQETGEHRRSTD